MEKKIWNLYCEVFNEGDLYPHDEFIARAKARTEELLPAPAGKKLGEPEEE